ncbi:flavin reductase family protein [Alteromonas gilva]|uniref:Flavin reductase n=1 Tax=Alteromonas gilva TaxID=2987522 RepID=A0ABT5L0R2_9ALTE|nr:flavin reductase [Alteromonas gilva]MDC8829403.1 flavin reductase [Alteromonas gilva]
MNTFDEHDIGSMAQRFRANFVNSLSGYKSANLIGTADAEGQTNLAIVSSVVHIGANPPLMGMIMRPHTVRRDTLGNIKTSGFYTINAVPAALYAQAHQTAARYDEGVSEFVQCGFKAQWRNGFAAPFVAQSPIQIGLKLVEIVNLTVNDTSLVVGQIQQVSVEETHIDDDGSVDIDALKLACISGLDTYHEANAIAKMAYAKPDEAPTVIKQY